MIKAITGSVHNKHIRMSVLEDTQQFTADDFEAIVSYSLTDYSGFLNGGCAHLDETKEINSEVLQ